MKIQQIKILQLNWGQLSPIWHPLVIEIETDQKIVGYGEAGVAYGAGVSAVAHLIQELGQRIIGKNPLLINQIWQDFYEHTFWAKGGGTLFYSAISAIDIALWDIKGKTANMPIYQLLGGKITSHTHNRNGWSKDAYTVFTPNSLPISRNPAIRQTPFKINVIIETDTGTNCVSTSARPLILPSTI